MNASSPDITVVIPNWNGMQWLAICLESLHAQTYKNFCVTVVDNGSSDESCEWISRKYPHIQVFELEQNTGFAHAVNIGINAASTPFVVLLNNDTRLPPDWVEKLRATILLSDEHVAGVCGKMLDMNNCAVIENAGDQLSWQGAAEKRGHGMSADLFNEREFIFSCCAGGALYRKSFFDQAGVFDESFFAYLEDIDLGLRGNLLGYRFLYEPAATIEHKGHGSGLPSAKYVRLTTANRIRLFIKNVPCGLLFRFSLSILYGQLYFLLCNRRPISSLLGYWDVLTDLPSLYRQRRMIKKASKLTNLEIQNLLQRKMNQPGLLTSLGRKLFGGSNKS